MSIRPIVSGFTLAFCLLTPYAKAQYFDFKRVDTTTVIHGGSPLSRAWLGGMNFCQFSKVDMDLDGTKDLLVFDRAGNQIIPFINQGGVGINYTYAPQYANYFPGGLNSWMLMVDYNCDNKEDIFSYSPGGMRVFKNISDTILKFELVVQLLRSSQLGNYLNLLVTSVDIPGICDIDGDGDKDVVTFGQFGKLIEYHRNYSVEFGYGCDSLPFVMKNECWGNFYESSASCSMTLLDTCPLNPFLGGPPQLAPTPAEYRQWFSQEALGADIINDGTERHTGSSVLALDLNGTNTKELLIGDVSCPHISGLMNGGSSPNTASSMISCDSLFPNYDVPVDISIFPAAYHLDMDNDGIRDLMVAPNYTVQSNNYDGNWYYKNTGTDLTPVFSYQQNALFQEDMIEHGEGSVPVFFDHNADGLKDLIIANAGIWDATHFPYDRHVSQLRLYLNTGTANKPEFTLTDTNYANIFPVHDTTHLLPAFGDLNGDGDMDMIIGDVEGRLHKYQNTAGAGNPAVFVIQFTNIIDDVGSIIDVGNNAAPHLADMDRDGDLDLLIGKNDGRISYYSNVGTPSVPSFKLITPTFGNVNVCEWWSGIGYSIPYVFDYDGEYHLFAGSLQGKVFHYDSIDNNLTGNFNLRDSLPDAYSYFGVSSAPAVADLNGDTLPEMMIGNFRGGLIMYTAASDTSSADAIDELFTTHTLDIYPNPAQHTVTLKTDITGKKSVQLLSVDGRKLREFTFATTETEIDISDLSNGVYIISVTGTGKFAARKNVRLVKR